MDEFKKQVTDVLYADRARQEDVIENLAKVHGARTAAVADNLMALQGALLTLVGTHVRAGLLKPDMAKLLIETLVGRLSENLMMLMDNYPEAMAVDISKLMGHALKRDMDTLTELFRLEKENLKRKRK